MWRKPHIGTFRLVAMVESMRATITALGGEIRFQSRVDGRRDRGAGECAAWRWRDGERIADRSRRARGRPQRARHVPDAPRPRRLHRGEAVLHRLSHRASAVAHRPRALRAQRRSSAPRRRGLQARSPLRQRTLGLQLLHVSRRDRRCRRLRSGPRRHERHEPVLAQRAKRQQRHRGRHHAAPTIPGHPLAGIAFQRHWEERAFEAGGGELRRAGAARRRFPRAPSLSWSRLGRPVLHAGRALDRSRRLPARLRRRGDTRGAAGVRQDRSRAMRWTTRC